MCVAVGCLTGVGQSDVGQPMPPVPAALLLLLLPRLPRRALLRGLLRDVRTRCACCCLSKWTALLGVGVPLELVLLAVLWE